MEYEKNTIQSSNPNGKTVDIIGRFCDVWGFGSVVRGFKDSLLKPLGQLGYNVNYTIYQMPGGHGEYYVFCVKGGQEKIVFSNNSGAHGSTGCIIGKRINDSNVESVINLITN